MVTDLFTKWVEAFPLHSTEATTLATLLVDVIVCRYGVPHSIHSNQNAIWLLQVSNISAHYWVWSDPKLWQTTRKAMGKWKGLTLAKVVQANQRDWDIHLPKVVFAYCTAIQESTHFMPYHLVFGRSPMLPAYVMLQRPYPHKQGKRE